MKFQASNLPCAVIWQLRSIACMAIVCIAAGQGNEAFAGGGPAIVSVQPTSIARSGQFTITGSNFGAQQGASKVVLDGVVQPVSFWSNTLIRAYALGDAALGPADLQVIANGGISAAFSVQINPIAPGEGRVKWRFMTDGFNIDHRPRVASDGTVHIMDGDGLVYALTPDGGLKWIFNTNGSGFGSTLDIGPDDTVYVGSNPPGPLLNVVAINPNGTLKWVHTDDSQETVSGPNVGPDGNIYIVHELGLNVFSLTPQGALRWSAGQGFDYGAHGAEIVFTPGRVHFCDDGELTTFDFNGNQQWEVSVTDDTEQVAVYRDGSVYVEGSPIPNGASLTKFDAATGNIVWGFDFNDDNGPPTNVLTAPDVGPDGAIYIGRNISQLWAINPDGTERWSITDPDSLTQVTPNASPHHGPIVNPQGTLLLTGAFGDMGPTGVPGLIKAFDAADGSLIFEIPLPFESGANFVPLARPFFRPDGQCAYIGIQPTGNNANYAYLYAIDTSITPPEVVGDVNGDQTVDIDDLFAVIAAWGPCPAPPADCPTDIDGDGDADIDDLFMVIANWS